VPLIRGPAAVTAHLIAAASRWGKFAADDTNIEKAKA
jgi:hypothetical protein